MLAPPAVVPMPVSAPVPKATSSANNYVALAAPAAVQPSPGNSKKISLTLRDTPIAEVFDMLARSERVSIVLGKGISGNISVSLYDVTLDQAVRAAAEAGGYAAERRGNAWLITDKSDLGKEVAGSETIVKSFKIQYSDAKLVGDIITKHLSRYGKVTPLLGRNMLVVEDRPENIAKVAMILEEVDREPRQILIEAKILQIDLTDEDQFGINWNRIFTLGSGNLGVKAGVQGYTLPTTGFFATVVGNVTNTLAALAKRNNVRTLSTPRLLALEGQQAQVQIGGQRGYKVTTVINLTATETIQFLDAGVILKVTPYVDDAGRIHMKLQPEVSDYDFVNGLPGKKTTTVSTNAIASDGETIFIGGLIRGKSAKDKQGVPGVSDVPVLGAFFSYQTQSEEASETVVLITPHLVEENRASRFEFNPDAKTRQFLNDREQRLNLMQPPESGAPATPPSAPVVPQVVPPVAPQQIPQPAAPAVQPQPQPSGMLAPPHQAVEKAAGLSAAPMALPVPADIQSVPITRPQLPESEGKIGLDLPLSKPLSTIYRGSVSVAVELSKAGAGQGDLRGQDPGAFVQEALPSPVSPPGADKVSSQSAVDGVTTEAPHSPSSASPVDAGAGGPLVVSGLSPGGG